ncbi:hypothetical protein D9756_011610 [Leucocoprinus leucothites]|uniref:Metallo-dependent hydrolase n=1 Tax=Leucocoprinus leucothites TaxID=201217 RepID=A0A8H5FNL7_9AGAR|nr:hypothetical protein D9756_011610 [Leucoagaricus leucothites]
MSLTRAFHASARAMGKKKSNTPSENWLLLPTPPSTTPIVDTHTHLASTFESYRQRYKQAKHETVFDFLRGFYAGRNVESIIDVWCEAPVRKLWREFADSAINAEDRKSKWDGIEYWFVMATKPNTTPMKSKPRCPPPFLLNQHALISLHSIEAMSHSRCVGWGEMGLDYHYDLSPRDVQRSVFRRQLKHAIRLGKPLTIHTREADDDTEAILKEEVPKDHPIHIHCFTDSPGFASNLLAHFPNLYIGITGVITYASNLSTSQVVQNLISSSSQLRILLETDAPYMIPANLYSSLPSTLDGESLKSRKLPICHSAMIPWVAEFVANVANQEEWTAERVMTTARENAKRVYRI